MQLGGYEMRIIFMINNLKKIVLLILLKSLRNQIHHNYNKCLSYMIQLYHMLMHSAYLKYYTDYYNSLVLGKEY